jgi:hypothetical protein
MTELEVHLLHPGSDHNIGDQNEKEQDNPEFQIMTFMLFFTLSVGKLLEKASGYLTEGFEYLAHLFGIQY